MAKNMSLGRYHELSSSSETWYVLGGILPGGDCSHLFERRCGSELFSAVLGSERPLWNTSSLCAKEDARVQALVTAISKAFAFSRRRFVHFLYVSLASP